MHGHCGFSRAVAEANGHRAHPSGMLQALELVIRDSKDVGAVAQAVQHGILALPQAHG